MKKIHFLFLVTVFVIIGMAYLGGYWQASSHFTDIRDVIEVTDCHKPTVEDCEMPVPQVAWYFAKLHAYMLLPSTLIGWFLISMGWRKYWGFWLPFLPLFTLILLIMGIAIYRVEFDFLKVGKFIAMAGLYYAIPMIVIGFLHCIIGICLPEIE